MIATDDLESYLDSNKRIQYKLTDSLKDLGSEGVVLVIIDAVEYASTNMGLIGFFEKRVMPGVFVSVNKPLVDLLVKLPHTEFVNTQVEFVDCISQMSGAKEIESERAHYLESPQQLVELSMMIHKLVQQIEGKKFLIVDSLSTLLIYNKAEAIEKFVHSISNKIRSEHVFGVLLMIKTDENRDVIKILSQFSDSVVEVHDKSI